MMPGRDANESQPAKDDLIGRLDALVRDAGGDPASFSGRLVREIFHTGIKLIGDGADEGELKIISRSLKELRYAMKVFRPYRDVRKVSIFGSARTPEDHPEYRAALKFSREISEKGWMVITGAGDGIMRAGHGGAGREASFGVSIRLPFETNANEFIAGDEKLVVFRYFFTRKLMFASQADAFVTFPGGFGTHDEGFEILTLVQTGKSHMVPIVLVDAPDGEYWKQWDFYVRGHLLKTGMISPEDTSLYFVTDDTQAALDHVLAFYRNYHSQRFVRDHLVIRMLRPLTDPQVDALNGEFADLVAEGRIEQRGPFDSEQRHRDLPRLSFVFAKKSYGRLRMMVDRINEFAG